MEGRKSIYKNQYSEKLLQTLITGVTPALGCTEPVAVGLAVAKAFEGVKGDVKRIDIKTSPNIFKNGMGVGIPGTQEIGLVFASALAISCGDANLGFEVFRDVNNWAIKEAEKLVEQDIIRIEIEEKKGDLYIEANVETSAGQGSCIIKNTHTNIVYVEANGRVIFENKEAQNNNSVTNDYLKKVDLRDIVEFVETVPYSHIEFLLEGRKLNMDIAKVGLDTRAGTGLAAAMKEMMGEGLMQKDIINEVRIMTAAASDARMAGVKMPVMSSAGSGNHGITAILPPSIVCKELACDDEKLARTLAFSHLITAYIKVFTGVLSPICGCAVAAGIGASSSITWALGGSMEQIEGSIKNMIGTLAGMVCDGAKGGCSFKLSTASSEAIIQSKLAMANVFINSRDGILHPDIKETIKNLGRFTNEGMENADKVIIDIMKNH